MAIKVEARLTLTVSDTARVHAAISMLAVALKDQESLGIEERIAVLEALTAQLKSIPR